MSVDAHANTPEPAELPAGAGVSLRIGERWEGHAEGVIAEVEPLPSAPGADERRASSRILLSTPGGQRELLLVLPRGVEAPVAVGERIEAHTESRVLGIHPVTDLWIVAGGELRLASSDSGDPAIAIGWEIGAPQPSDAPPPRANGMATRVEQAVLFRRREALGRVGGNLWRCLETAEGPWWISGHAVAWGPGNLPPDASSYFRYALVRGAR